MCRTERTAAWIVISADERIDGDDAVAAGAILDNNRSVPTDCQFIGKQPGANVGAASGAEGQYEFDCPVGPALRGRRRCSSEEHKRDEAGLGPSAEQCGEICASSASWRSYWMTWFSVLLTVDAGEDCACNHAILSYKR